jgi:hypothetical protein
MTTNLTPADIFRPELLSGVVELRLTEQGGEYSLGDLMPIKSTNRLRVQMNIRQGTRTRLGQFRAANAPTPISVGRFQAARMSIELVMLSEKEIIDEYTLLLLNSVDPGMATEAVTEILDQATRLRGQNNTLKTWMGWRAFLDTLTVTYPNGSSIDIDFDLDNTDGKMSASHKPTASVLWSNPASDIIGDVRAWCLILTNDSGVPASRITLTISTPVWLNIQLNTALMAKVGTAADPKSPDDPAQVARILGLRAIKLYDETYEDAAGVVQRFLPISKGLFTIDKAGGQPVAWMLDGPVAQYNASNQRVKVGNNPGAVTEIWGDADPPSENVRVTTSNMPVIIREGVVMATVQ